MPCLCDVTGSTSRLYIGDRCAPRVLLPRRLKAAKSGGWLSEEEFDTEVKRLIREHNGEAREPAYAFNDVVDIMGDEAQMAEWEARYGDAAAGDRAGEPGHRPPPLAAVDQAGSVELDLTGGGVAAPSMVNSLLQEIEAEGGSALADLSDMQQGGHERGQGEAGGEVASVDLAALTLSGGQEGEAAAEGEVAASTAAPTTPKAQQVPTSDDIGDFLEGGDS
jgi:hypothetical protein